MHASGPTHVAVDKHQIWSTDCLQYKGMILFSIIQGDLRGIMSPAEQKMQPAIHQEKNPDIYRFDVRLFVAMYCGLHLLFRRAHYSS
jgi:hypothetical protein